MEHLTDSEVKNLVKELSEGREVARQLQAHLSGHSSTTSYETQQFLLHRVLSSYDHALSMLQHSSHQPAQVPAAMDSPGDPQSEDSDQDVVKDHQQDSRKRKGHVARWTQQVTVWPETEIKGQLDDGYGWRKYGQKDILGARHPRGYYRCTHRHEQGCLATKQVQRSDDDPHTYIITYRRDHTCNPHVGTNPPDPNPLPSNLQQQPGAPLHRSQAQESYFDIQTSLRVISQDLTTNQSQLNYPNNPQNDNIFGNYLPHLDSDFEGLIPDLMQATVSELSSVVTSGTNTAAAGTSFLAGSSDLGSNFAFGNPGYYP